MSPVAIFTDVLEVAKNSSVPFLDGSIYKSPLVLPIRSLVFPSYSAKLPEMPVPEISTWINPALSFSLYVAVRYLSGVAVGEKSAI